MNRDLAEGFIAFAESECKGSSPLYYELSHNIAKEGAILEIVGQANPSQPIPNLLFASVHCLLLSGIAHPLSAFYATCTSQPGNPTEAYPDFKDFVNVYRDEIVSQLTSRLVQTNEVRRCAYLYPAISFAASHYESKPLALIEIGTSAGLNLIWDRYRYSYGDSAVYGDSSSPVLITSSFRGAIPTILSGPVPNIVKRIGLDLKVIDPSVPEQVDWLRGLIWPEHHERSCLLDAALKIRSKVDLDLRSGDGFSMLGEVANEISEETLVGVYHTHVANQIPKQAREAFLSSIEALGSRRDLIHIFNNIKPNLHLTAYRNGRLTLDPPLANVDGHARWIEWLLKN